MVWCFVMIVWARFSSTTHQPNQPPKQGQKANVLQFVSDGNEILQILKSTYLFFWKKSTMSLLTQDSASATCCLRLFLNAVTVKPVDASSTAARHPFRWKHPTTFPSTRDPMILFKRCALSSTSKQPSSERYPLL